MTPGSLLQPRRFLMVSPLLVNRLGPTTALVVVAMDYRGRDPDAEAEVDRAGVRWMRWTLDALADATGLTKHQVRGALNDGVNRGVLLVHRRDGDRARWYTIDYGHELLVEEVPQWRVKVDGNVRNPHVSDAPEGAKSAHAPFSKKGVSPKGDTYASMCEIRTSDAMGSDTSTSSRPNQQTAREALRLAWDKRVEHGRPRPTCRGGFIALARIVEQMLDAGNDPREVALAVFYNDGAWTLNALNESLRQVRERAAGRRPRNESATEREARLLAKAERIHVEEGREIG